MAPGSNTRRIIRSWPGPGTTETRYEDDQGGVWREDPFFTPSNSTTGQTIAYRYGDTLFTKRV